MNRIAIGFIAMAMVAGAIAAGYWWGRSRTNDPPSSSAVAPAPSPKILYWYDPMLPTEHHAGPGKSSMGMTLAPKYAEQPDTGARKPLYWYDPMVPAQHFDKPGKSSFMDMPLVPRYADEADDAGIRIDTGTRQNMGLRTVEVRRGRLADALTVPGTIAWDLRDERIVSARVDAIVARLYVRTPYAKVAVGQPLAELIAPTWSSALAEANALRDARSETARALRADADARLASLGLPADAQAHGGRITLTAPIAGVVSEIGVREGQSAPAGTLLFRIDSTATVWVEAAIPQSEVANIATGTPVEVALDAHPGQTWHGRVETLLPQVDTSSRTQRARIVVDNPNGELAPGQFVQATLRPVSGAESVLAPSEALIGSSAQQRVIVLGADDRFHPVLVRTGRSSEGMTEILDGLHGGERIVASGQFLIDSEASLSGSLERLEAGANELKTPDQTQQEPQP